jgi:hypothetical protein
MQFSEYYQQLVRQQLAQQQLIQEVIYFSQEQLLRRTHQTFLALCCFLAAQSFTIPIIPIGPWAVWICLPDLAIAYLVWAFIQENSHLRIPSVANRTILQVLITVILGAIPSYIIYFTAFQQDGGKGINFGLFQIYRLLQFIAVFWISSRIPLDAKRIATLKRITVWVLLFVCAGIILTFFAIVPLTLIGAHLPKSTAIAGPWAYLSTYRIGNGWGTIGYSHAYVASQVILLMGVTLHLSHSLNDRSPISFYLIMATLSCFLSGSRSGFAAMLLLALVYWLRKPAYMLTVLGMGLLIVPFFEGLKWILSASQSTDGVILDRQLTLLDATNPEQLSGRGEIWMERLQFLDAEPLRWFWGSGFGSAVDSGNNAHMLPLHITLETGVIGLALFIILFGLILYSLYRHEVASKAMFLTTFVLLISSVSQETFYPVPAQGHFLGFYLCCLAVSLREPLRSPLTSQEPDWLRTRSQLVWAEKAGRPS